MARKPAAPKPEALTVEGVWPEVFTGLDNPARIKKGETVTLPVAVAEILIATKAAKRV